jgi:hypothetical protein
MATGSEAVDEPDDVDLDERAEDVLDGDFVTESEHEARREE